MPPAARDILAVHRSHANLKNRFLQWQDAAQVISNIETSATWLDRAFAERSKDHIQPIPCALVRNTAGQYCVFRSVKDARKDLSSRLSLVAGGHIDYTDANKSTSLMETLTKTVKRELAEEIGVTDIESLQPVGIVFDGATVTSSRHVAIVFDAITTEKPRPAAPEEFSLRSRYAGRYLSADELLTCHSKFDPWSQILVEEYVAKGSHLPESRRHQMKLPLLVED